MNGLPADRERIRSPQFRDTLATQLMANQLTGHDQALQFSFNFIL
jgi:hypothetical protein